MKVRMIIGSVYCSFFFFKQKTAYEMRISDWSSDVCSSDLAPPASAVRMLLLLELLYGSGLRASELVSLPRRAVAGEREYLIIRGKGDKERLVPLSARAREAFDRWLPLLSDGSPWLFPSGQAHISPVRLFQMLRGQIG